MTATVIERRVASGVVELRADGDPERPVAAGYAAVFGRRSLDLGGFTELVDRGAFTKSVAEADVVGLWNHDDGCLLGRVTAGTLRLDVDERGLAYEIDVPSTTVGRDLVVLLERGDVRGSSFGFRVIRDEWFQDDDGDVTRTLLEVALIDVSPVSRPAYLDTDATLRGLAAVTDHDLAEVRKAHAERRLGTLLAPSGGGRQVPATGDGRGSPTVTRRMGTWSF